MAKSLQSYFTALATELKIDLDSIIVRPDNARTIKGTFDESVFECQHDEITSRWMMESSCSSDVSLSVPRRSSTDSLHDERAKITYQEPVMGAAERWLRELPIEGLSIEGQQQQLLQDEIPKSAQRVKSFDDDSLTDRYEDGSDTDDDMPILKGCRFGFDEKHPASSQLAPERLTQSPSLGENNIDDSREDTSTHPETKKVAIVKGGDRPSSKNDMECIMRTARSHHSSNTGGKREKGHFNALQSCLASSIMRKASFE